ncbi:rhomboid family intramembrane serine protease [Candidatus Woesearchaeota archaeon]|nr:rhomboid family intramembrane serine protease [Candidatus Woesearchaeota archaeon]
MRIGKYRINNAVLPLVVINVVVFLLQIIIGNGFTEMFMLISSDIFTRPWILLTSMFLHGGPFHLFFNMYVLFMFGTLLENRIRTGKFLALYFLSGIFASFVASFFYSRALGASGAIFGILGAIVILIPNLKVMPLFIPVPMDLWKALLIFTILDIFFFSNIAVMAHIAGGVFGVLFGLYFQKKQKVRIYKKPHSPGTHMTSEDIEDYLRRGRI